MADRPDRAGGAGRPTGPPRGAVDRVRSAHRQVRWTAPLIVLFLVASLGAAVASNPWAALHLGLAGAAVLLISAIALMLTVTWSAAPAPSDAVVALQRVCIVVGVTAVVAGREAGAPTALVITGAAMYAVGLLLLAAVLVVTVRQGVQRRFDVPVAGFVVAAVAGVVGAAFGAALAIGPVTATRLDVHRTVNLLGLVGLVISSTLPYFAATVGRTKMATAATPRRLAGVLVGQSAALALVVVGVMSSWPLVGSAGLGAYAAGLLVVLTLLPRPTMRQLRWSGPRLFGLWAGTGWWVAVVVVGAVSLARGRAPFAAPWTTVLVVAAYGQIVWGSLAYLLPVLRGGGHEHLARGFATTRSWLALAAVNAAGVALVAGRPGVAVAAVVVWVLDTAVRAALLVVPRGARTSRT